MLMSLIRTDPKKYQFRDTAFAETTVDGIVAAFDPALFDPIPVIREGDGGVVGGDGHSRLEAVRRLAPTARLPDAWHVAGDIDVPVREIEADDAARLAYCANMSRSPFTAPEQARLFRARLDAGEALADVARTSFVSPAYVRKRLLLLVLCRTIRDAVGHPWGIDVDKATVLAEAFTRDAISKQTQQRLWLTVISKGDWTPHTLRLLMSRLGPKLAASNDKGSFLFDLPPNVGVQLEELTTASKQRREAYRGLVRVYGCREGLRDAWPALWRLLETEGESQLERLRACQEEDAAILNGLLT